MNPQTKLEYYDILNSVRMEYLKSNIPFSIVNRSDIKLTYNDIKLKYINDKNYFVKVDKSKGKFQQDRTPWTKEQKKEFYKQKAREERDAPKINMDEPWSVEKRDEYRRLKEQSSLKNNKDGYKGTDPNINRDRNRSQSPKREFTPEETAAYLERKAKREKKGGNALIMVFY